MSYRSLSLATALVLTAGTLSACGSSSDTSASAPADTDAPTTAATTPAETTPAAAATPTASTKGVGTSKDAKTGVCKLLKPKYVIQAVIEPREPENGGAFCAYYSQASTGPQSSQTLSVLVNSTASIKKHNKGKAGTVSGAYDAAFKAAAETPVAHPKAVTGVGSKAFTTDNGAGTTIFWIGPRGLYTLQNLSYDPAFKISAAKVLTMARAISKEG